MDFSFLICTRNSERTISEVIGSIVDQDIDLSLIEVIMSDYQSSDSTVSIARNILARYGIKFTLIQCALPGKSPALTLALDAARGQYSIIVDDDNILFPDYIHNARILLKEGKVGCLGAQGVLDENLQPPEWFSEYQGHFAIGTVSKAKDWVWGACALINMAAWKQLRSRGFKIQLNPERTTQSQPIALGGEDTELSLAIFMIGYVVRFSEKLKFKHKFEQRRMSKEYLIQNTYGCSRSVPLTEIYRMAIYRSTLYFPKFVWSLFVMRMIIGCSVRAVKSYIFQDTLRAKYNYAIGTGILSGYLRFRKDFSRIYNELMAIRGSRAV